MTNQLDQPAMGEAFVSLQRGVRLRSLIVLRWMAVAGQTATVLFVSFVLGFDMPLTASLAVIAASAWLNIYLVFAQPGARILGDGEAAAHLTFDVLQLGALIALTGGLANPFVLLLAAPVVVGFTSIRAIYALIPALAAAAVTALMARWSGPLPWSPGEQFSPPPLFQAGLWAALATGAGFMSIYALRLGLDARRMSTALAATQLVLAREQRLSALGGLAAAAAHELGTPLGTIQITAKEMARQIKDDDALREDAELLVSQAERCRDILRQLSSRGDKDDAVHAQLSLRELLNEVAEPLTGLGPEIDVVLEPPGGEAVAHSPQLRRSPEILYAVANFVENAVDYADKIITVTGRWDGGWVEVEVSDDGRGFAQEILAQLGEPYVSRRAAGLQHGGLGLGFFIAKTFVERTGGRVTFGNKRAPQTGAVVRARWALSKIAAPAN